MDNKRKAKLVCVSSLSNNQLDTVYKKLTDTYNEVEVLCEGSESGIIEWAKNKAVQYKSFCRENNLLFSTPNPKITLSLPDDFVTAAELYFVCDASISADNYLCGAIYNLSKLITGKTVTDYDFPDYALEMYFYFRNNTFFVFSNNEVIPMSGNAWAIDCFIISSLKLQTKYLYRLFYKYLTMPVELNTGLKLHPVVLKTRLYPGGYEVSFFINKLQLFIRSFFNAFSILYTMLSFKLKRKFKK